VYFVIVKFIFLINSNLKLLILTIYMNNILLANIIYYIHLTFICIMLISPYSNNKHLYKFYYIMVPLLFIRWAFNFSQCTITLYECKLRGIKEESGFIYRIITPIFNNSIAKILKIKNEKNFNLILYIYMFITWIILCYNSRFSERFAFRNL
jgi:hypothetical protein